MTSFADVKWPRECLGIHVAQDVVTFCVVRDSAVVFHRVVELVEQESLHEAVVRTIRAIPARAFVHRRCRVAVEAHAAIYKRLAGFNDSSTDELTQAISDTPERFFVAPFASVVVSEAFVSDTGDVWAAAFDATLVQELRTSLRPARFHRVDFCTVRELTLQRKSATTEDPDRESDIAQAAADLRIVTHANLGAELGGTAGRMPVRHAVRSAVALCACMALGALTESVIHARRDAAFVKHNHQASVLARTEALRARQFEDEVARLDRFTGRRVPVTALLADIGRALDTVATVEWLELNDSIAELSIDAERAATVPGILSHLTSVRAAEVVGGIVRRPEHEDREQAVVRLHLHQRGERP